MKGAADYYQSNRPVEKVMNQLKHMYGDRDSFRVEELAFVDSFHIRGRAATISLATATGIREDSKVLDVGSGPGGTARYLSSAFGAAVVGLDLTYEFTRLASILSKTVSLVGQNRFVCGNALDLPFNEACFDMVWMEHVQMNILNKKALAEEFLRVLKPGGSLALYEVFQTGEPPPDYPLPWTETPGAGFLISPEEMKELLGTAGFCISHWHDCHDEIGNWYETVRGQRKSTENQVPGVHLLMGDQAGEKVANMTKSVLDRRLTVIEAVLRK